MLHVLLVPPFSGFQSGGGCPVRTALLKVSPSCKIHCPIFFNLIFIPPPSLGIWHPCLLEIPFLWAFGSACLSGSSFSVLFAGSIHFYGRPVCLFLFLFLHFLPPVPILVSWLEILPVCWGFPNMHPSPTLSPEHYAHISTHLLSILLHTQLASPKGFWFFNSSLTPKAIFHSGFSVLIIGIPIHLLLRQKRFHTSPPTSTFVSNIYLESNHFFPPSPSLQSDLIQASNLLLGLL